MVPNMKAKYTAEVAPALMKKFEYESVMQIPKIDKVVINVINEPLPVFFLQCIEYILIRIVDLFKLRVIFDNQVKGILLRHVFIDSP